MLGSSMYLEITDWQRVDSSKSAIGWLTWLYLVRNLIWVYLGGLVCLARAHDGADVEVKKSETCAWRLCRTLLHSLVAPRTRQAIL